MGSHMACILHRSRGDRGFFFCMCDLFQGTLHYIALPHLTVHYSAKASETPASGLTVIFGLGFATEKEDTL